MSIRIDRGGAAALVTGASSGLGAHFARLLVRGYIETEINRDFLASPAGKAIAKRIPAGRFGQPADLDGALLLLASEAGRYINGAVIPVDGGHLVSAL